MDRSPNLLDEALGDDSAGFNGVILIEDCVETSGAFVLHHLIKRSLSSSHSSALLIFVAFAQPLSHYDRILRKMGCNLVVQRDNKRLLFLDMLTLECPGGDGRKTGEGGLHALYGKIHKAVEVTSLAEGNKNVIIMIDDISLMEVAANGSSNDVLDFLHYCHTLTTQFGCSFVVLAHEDIYAATDRATLILQMEYLADVLVKVEPLATGLAADVHGQLTVLNKGVCDGLGSSRNKMRNFHFRLKESCAEYFYPVKFSKIQSERWWETLRSGPTLSSPDVLTDDVVDIAIGLALATLRKICASDGFVRKGLWKNGDFQLTTKDVENSMDIEDEAEGEEIEQFDVGRTRSTIWSHFTKSKIE